MPTQTKSASTNAANVNPMLSSSTPAPETCVAEAEADAASLVAATPLWLAVLDPEEDAEAAAIVAVLVAPALVEGDAAAVVALLPTTVTRVLAAVAAVEE